MSAVEESIAKDIKKHKAWGQNASKKNSVGQTGNEQSYNSDNPLKTASTDLKIVDDFTDIESKADYSQTMDSSEKICIETDNNANKVRATKESTEDIGMDVSIDLQNTFASFSQEEQEAAIAHVQSLKEKAILSPLEQLKEDYIKFPENTKITVDAVLAHLKPQLKDYVKAWGAKEDLIYLDDLREVEALTTKMYQAFYRLHKRTIKDDNPSPLMSDLISKKKEKVTKKLANYKQTDETTAKEYQYIASIKQGRQNNKTKECQYIASANIEPHNEEPSVITL